MRKEFYLITIILFVFVHAFSQNEKVDFSRIDNYVKSVKGNGDLPKLSLRLTSPYKTDLEKTRAIFRWITENIAYDTKEYHLDTSLSSYRKLFAKIDPTEKNIDEVYINEIAKYVVKNKKAICEGYAALFKMLCDHSGLKAEIIHGTAKNSVKEIGTAIPENHAWNAIFLDGKWKLLDVTWASGYCNDSVTIFTKKFNEVYFLTPPRKLIVNHFPSDPKWFLLPNPPLKNKFLSYPLVYDGFFKNNISSYSPINGVIEAKIGNKVIFNLTIPDSDSKISVSSKTGSDDVKIKKEEKVVTYEYTVTSDKDDDLEIFLNNEAVFSYRIVVVPQ